MMLPYIIHRERIMFLHFQYLQINILKSKLTEVGADSSSVSWITDYLTESP